MGWIIWLVAAIVLVIFEIATTSLFFFLCLAIGSLFAALLSYFYPGFWAETTVFAVMTFLAILFVRPLFKKYLKTTSAKDSNVDELIGKDAFVTEKITLKESGFVKVMGEIWSAKSDEEIAKDSVVTIISVSGTKLNVKKK
jgi:Membrane protein implicated in regulation of membrane protease activity